MRFITNAEGKVSASKVAANLLLPGAGYLVGNRPAEPEAVAPSPVVAPAPVVVAPAPMPEAVPVAPRCEQCGSASWAPDAMRAAMLGRLAKPVVVCLGCGARRKLAHR